MHTREKQKDEDFVTDTVTFIASHITINFCTLTVSQKGFRDC